MKTSTASIFANNKKQVSAHLAKFFQQKAKTLRTTSPQAKKLLKFFRGFTSEGKMLRAGLVNVGYHLFSKSKTTPASVIEAGAAIELWHSSILVHDDIIDRDRVRRSKPTMFVDYEMRGRKMGVSDPAHFGQSMSIAGADAGICWAFEMLAALPINPKTATRLSALAAQEWSSTALQEMQDVYLGYETTKVTKKEIINLYIYKTAQYTFSFPLQAGALLAGANSKSRTFKALGNFGKNLGILFQIKDDEIGIFGKDSEIGKPQGSDIREGKQTLLYYFLKKSALPAQKKKLYKIFGNPKATQQDYEYVRSLMVSSGSLAAVKEIMNGFAKKASASIKNLPYSTAFTEVLTDLVEYSNNRIK